MITTDAGKSGREYVMKFRHYLMLVSVLLISVSNPEPSQAETTIEEATACFDTMLGDAKAGESFSSMAEKYVSLSAIANRAVKVQKGLIWKNLSEAERAPFIAAIQAYFATEAEKVRKGIGQNDYVKLETVALRPRYHKKVGGGYQLAGIYTTEGGSPENFALYIVRHEGKCSIYDARWRSAWLSKYVKLP